MTSEAARFFPLETGGLLLGWRDQRDLIVAGMIGAGPRALHGRYAFYPDHQWQIRELKLAFEATNGDMDYLGDWHTHPGGAAAMSSEDRATLRRISRRTKYPAMVILAGGEDEWKVKVWRGNTKRRVLSSEFKVLDEGFRIFAPPEEWPSSIRTYNR